MSNPNPDSNPRVMVKAWACPYDPTVLSGEPIGQFHCPSCGCVVIARIPHGLCFAAFCPAVEEGWHPGHQVETEIRAGDAEWLM